MLQIETLPQRRKHEDILNAYFTRYYRHLSSNFNVFVVTWNCGDSAPPGDLSSIFKHAEPLESEGVSAGTAELVVVCTQECAYSVSKKDRGNTPLRNGVNSSKEATIDALTRGHDACHYDFVTKVQRALQQHSLMAFECLWDISVSVFLRDDLYSFKEELISELQTAKEATGLLHVAGNKGGVAIGFEIFGTRVLFVGSHLAAHLGKIDRRNEDMFEIIQGVHRKGFYAVPSCNTEPKRKGKLNKGQALLESPLEASSPQVVNLPPFINLEVLNYYHHIFWAGDLNYRIAGLPLETVIRAANSNDISQIRPYDQLSEMMLSGEVFPGFKEGNIAFPPTYRFIRNTDPAVPFPEYDRTKSRIPSWCDRILHRSLGHEIDKAVCLNYSCVSDIRTSDHLPVYSTFQCQNRDVKLRSRDDLWPTRFQTASIPSPKGPVKLRISGLRCNGLRVADINGLSDPYVVFIVPGMTMAKTDVITGTLNPNWGANKGWELTSILSRDTLAIDPASMNPEELNIEQTKFITMTYLYCVLLDKDFGTADESLGGCAIPLHHVDPSLGYSGGPIRMERFPVLYFGKSSGSLSCTIELLNFTPAKTVQPSLFSLPISGAKEQTVMKVGNTMVDSEERAKKIFYEGMDHLLKVVRSATSEEDACTDEQHRSRMSKLFRDYARDNGLDQPLPDDSKGISHSQPISRNLLALMAASAFQT